MARVYISSTYKDLKGERQTAFEAVRHSQHLPVGMEYYGSSPRRPLEECVRDVRNCHAYVGIIGWRYGFVPLEGGGKSIVHLEYEAASNIPRFLYLTPEPYHGRLDSSIIDFREYLKVEHTISFFDDFQDLRFKIFRDLIIHLGQGFSKTRIFPDLLPYLCDRRPQEDALADALLSSRNERNSKPVITIVHGDEMQSITKFMDCMKENYLPRLLGLPKSLAVISEYQTRWPTENASAENFQRLLSRELALEICNRPQATSQETVFRLSQLGTPVMISGQFPRRAWQIRSFSPLLAFVDYWNKWPAMSPSQVLIVLLAIQYPRVEGSWLRRRHIRKSNLKIKAKLSELSSLESSAGCLVILPELKDLDRDDVEEWLRRDDVKEILGYMDLAEDISRIFAEGSELPMQRVASSLNIILHDRCT